MLFHLIQDLMALQESLHYDSRSDLCNSHQKRIQDWRLLQYSTLGQFVDHRVLRHQEVSLLRASSLERSYILSRDQFHNLQLALCGLLWAWDEAMIASRENVGGKAILFTLFIPWTTKADILLLSIVMLLACIVDRARLTGESEISNDLHVSSRTKIKSDCISSMAYINLSWLGLSLCDRYTGTIAEFLLHELELLYSETLGCGMGRTLFIAEPLEELFCKPVCRFSRIFMSPCNDVGWNLEQTLQRFLFLHLLEMWTPSLTAKT